MIDKNLAHGIGPSYGNIWDFHKDFWIVIPTNLGWKSNGENVMGAGLAKQAALKFPELPKWYGRSLYETKGKLGVATYPDARLIMFPVKPLNESAPHLSWKSDALIEMVEESTKQLVQVQRILDADIALPLVGCGAGNLKEEQVMPILKKYLSNGHFLVVIQR